ncbi:MAG TPA: ribose-5-phosphate isomerase RpiA [Devosia sp.]|nr:ribose-5-phosphate isomerase RpiA [Devosia sp.]
MTDDLKRMAAAAALAEIRPGMRLGLGTGSTARHLVDLVGARVREGLELVCVPTSEATAAQARSLGIPLTTLEETPELDLTIDGADEIGPGLGLIKGAGGALLREKIVAAASRRMVVIADAGKRVAALGRFPLSIEVNRFGLRATQIAVERVAAAHEAEGPVKLRLTTAGEPFVTDGGHLILDAFFGRISDPEALSTDLHDVPGVVEHGLFLKLCQRAYVAAADGVETIDA